MNGVQKLTFSFIFIFLIQLLFAIQFVQLFCTVSNFSFFFLQAGLRQQDCIESHQISSVKGMGVNYIWCYLCLMKCAAIEILLFGLVNVNINVIVNVCHVNSTLKWTSYMYLWSKFGNKSGVTYHHSVTNMLWRKLL